MSRKKPVVIHSRKPQPNPYTSRIRKPPSKHALKSSLKHAVHNHDFDALENYDEEQLRPPTGAVADPGPDPDFVAYLGEDDDDEPYRVKANGHCVPEDDWSGDDWDWDW